MGGMSSKEYHIDEKVVDANGRINNNVIIRGTHTIMEVNERILIAMYFLCVMKVIELAIYGFNAYKKALKKRYGIKHDPDNRA